MENDKSARGNASQFFVAGELCRRGYVAVVTMRTEGMLLHPLRRGLRILRLIDKAVGRGLKSERG